MPKCYYCGSEFPNLTQCPHCKQHYCTNHSESNQHDCPLTPIQNPFELSSEPSIPSTTPMEDLTPTSLSDTGSSNVVTDGSYYWHRKPDQEEVPDAFDPRCLKKYENVHPCFPW